MSDLVPPEKRTARHTSPEATPPASKQGVASCLPPSCAGSSPPRVASDSHVGHRNFVASYMAAILWSGHLLEKVGVIRRGDALRPARGRLHLLGQPFLRDSC